MLNISTQDQKLLVEQSNLKKLENNLYLRDTENENYKYIKWKFFTYEWEDKAKLMNIGSWLFNTISDIFSYYVGNPSYEFGVMFDDFTRDLVALWFCTIGIEREDGKLKLVYQPAKNYWNDNWIDKISRLYIDDQDNVYVLVQSYYIGYIENKLYSMPWYTLQQWVEVPLDTIPQTADLLPTIQTGLDTTALLIVQEWDISIFEKIKQLVYSVDRQIVMNHTQYLQNVESFVIFKGIKRPQKLLEDYNKGKRIDFSQIGRIINGDENSTVEFVNNINSLIETSLKDMDNNIRRIASMTSVPIEFLWLDSNEWAVGLGSRTLRHWVFIKKVQYIRDLFDEALNAFVELTGEDISYNRPDIFAKSDTELVEELKIAREIKVISLMSAIKKYNGYTEEEAQIEYDLIQWQDLPLTTIDG